MRDIRQENAGFLHGLAALVDRLDTECFTLVLAPAMTASIGAHVRHVHDHYHALLRDLPTGRIDYENRARDGRLETDRHIAAAELRRMAALVVNTRELDLERRVSVRDGAIAGGSWSHSTLGRELEFLMSHAIHHCSLIAVACRLQEIGVDPELGFAPSTLRHLAGMRRARAC